MKNQRFGKMCANLLLATFIFVCTIAMGAVKVNAVSYSVETIKDNYAYNETIKVRYTASSNAKDWVGIYKADAEVGKESALAFKYISGSRNTLSFVPNDFISYQYSAEKGLPLEPGEYKAIIATNDSYNVEDYYYFTIGEGNPDYSFDVISDCHITAGANVDNNNLTYALQDIKKYSKNSSAVVFNGDTVDSYDWYAYDKVRSICSKYGKELPFMFLNMGNHELFDNANVNSYGQISYSDKIYRLGYFGDSVNRVSGRGDSVYMPLYSNLCDKKTPYYTTKLKDSNEEDDVNGTFVFIGSQSMNYGNKADLKDEQLRWLNEDVLYPISKYQEHQPIFVFGHQGLYKTVAGTHPYIDYYGYTKDWSGVQQDGGLSFVLNKYSNVIYFSGHSHWDLKQPYGPAQEIMYRGNPTYGNGLGATMFTDGGVANSWNYEYERKYNDVYSGSTGMHVDVYGDKVVVKGRDFANGKWISGARFVLDLDEMYSSLDDAMKNQ